MSITRRILDSAQSGLSKLTSLVIVDDDPLSNVEGAALQAELTARKAARAKRTAPAGDTPLAKQALATPAARAARDKAARERAARVHRERDEREVKQRAAADDAFRRMKEQAARAGSSTSSSSWSGSTGSSSSHKPSRPSGDPHLAEWYRVLDLQPGADLAQIKTSYRQLMRKYHPDMHAGNPQKQKAANELSMRVTAAYNGLVAHVERK
ncbi:MAG TPA: J domain-containing protein [Kofleriaceae bacterium]